jgi:hypothetical protein
VTYLRPPRQVAANQAPGATAGAWNECSQPTITRGRANAALLNHDIELTDLYDHYASLEDTADSEIADIDKRWFVERERADAVSVIGLDIADKAARYSATVGLLDQAVVADLESGAPDKDAVRAFATADLVGVTGGIGYVGRKTFQSIVAVRDGEPPWVAALCLRWVDFAPIAEAFDDVGLVTERLDGYCMPQRRFADDAERRAAIDGLHDHGLDPGPELELGAHCAELYVSRPPEAVKATPLADILGDLTMG